MVSKNQLQRAHARDLVQIRLFMRALIESQPAGIKVVGHLIGRLHGSDTLEKIFEEEMNYQLFVNDYEVRRAILSGELVLTLPVADLSIVKEELPRRSERLKMKMTTY